MRELIANFLGNQITLTVLQEKLKTVNNINEILSPFKYENIVYRQYTALEFAVKSKNSDLVSALINAGAKVDFGNDKLLPVAVENLAISDEAKNDDICFKIIKSLISNILNNKTHGKININVCSKDGGSILYYAALKGKDDIIKLLLQHSKIDINVSGNGKLPPIFHAVQHGHGSVVEILCQSGADLFSRQAQQMQNNKKITGLADLFLAAIDNKHFHIISILLKHTSPSDKCLECVYGGKDYNTLEILLKNGVSANTIMAGTNKDGNSTKVTLIQAASTMGLSNFVTLLLSYGADPNILFSNGQTLLSVLASINQVEIMHILLNSKKIKNINQVDEDNDKETALHKAVYCGHYDATKLLFTHGAKSDILNTKGLCPLNYVIQKKTDSLFLMSINHIKFFKLSDENYLYLYKDQKGFFYCISNNQKIYLELEARVEENLKKISFNQPPNNPVKCKDEELYIAILKQYANTFQRNNFSLIPLFKKELDKYSFSISGNAIRSIHYAIYNTEANLLISLCENGSSPNFIENDFTPPLTLAILFQEIEILSVLLKYGANPNGHFGDIMPLLKLAILLNNFQIIEMLVTHKSFIKNPGFLCLAIENGLADIVKIMLQNDFDPLASSHLISPLFCAIYLNREEIINSIVHFLKNKDRIEELEKHINFYLSLFPLLQTSITDDVLVQMKNKLDNIIFLIEKAPVKTNIESSIAFTFFTPPSTSASTSSHSYLSTEMGLTSEQIKNLKNELKQKHIKRRETSHVQTKSATSEKILTWFNGAIDSSMFQKIENTHGQGNHFIWLPEIEILAQGCTQKLFNQFNTPPYKFNGENTKNMKHLKISTAFEINGEIKYLNLEWELRVHQSPARVFLFSIESDDCSATLHIGGRFLKKGLHDNSTVKAFKQSCVMAKPYKITLPICLESHKENSFRI